MFKYLIKGKTPSIKKNGFEFKMQYSYEKRKEESKRIKDKYPDKVPIILEKSEKSTLPMLDKQKFLLQRDLTIGQFIYIIRQKINLSSKEAIFIFIDSSHGKSIPTISKTLGETYDKYSDMDGFLYLSYNAEETFG